MARIDDYINAKKIAAEDLSKKSFDEICKDSGFEVEKANVIIIPFLNRIYHIIYPSFDFIDEENKKDNSVPIQEQVLILHYLEGLGHSKLSGRFVSYREIPGASFYYGAFVNRAINPLKNVFGKNISGLKKAAGILNGRSIHPGDVSFEFKVFPNVVIQLIIWQGDDEFPAEANIIFDDAIIKIFSPEDIAWLSGMLVYRLIALSR